MLDRDDLLESVNCSGIDQIMYMTLCSYCKFNDYLHNDTRDEGLKQFYVKYIYNETISVTSRDDTILRFVLNANPINIWLAFQGKYDVNGLTHKHVTFATVDSLLEGKRRNKYEEFIAFTNSMLDKIDEYLSLNPDKYIDDSLYKINGSAEYYLTNLAKILLYQVNRYEKYISLCNYYKSTSLRTVVGTVVGEEFSCMTNLKFKSGLFSKCSCTNDEYLDNHVKNVLVAYANGADLSEDDILLSIKLLDEHIHFEYYRFRFRRLHLNRVSFNTIKDYVERTKHLISHKN